MHRATSLRGWAWTSFTIATLVLGGCGGSSSPADPGDLDAWQPDAPGLDGSDAPPQDDGTGDGGFDAGIDGWTDPGPEDPGDPPLPEDAVEPHVEMRQGIRILWLAGTPRQMGRQQGTLLHDLIATAMDFIEQDPLMSMLPELAEQTGVLDILRATAYPDVIEECEGLVEAAGDVGMDMTRCLVLNGGDVMLQFVLHGLPPDWIPPREACSGVIATGPATADGRLLHARNLDWGSMDISIVHQNPTIQVRQPSGGIPHAVIGFPMNLSPYTGINEAGISLGTNAIDPADPTETTAAGRSNVQMTRQILSRFRSLPEVEEFVRAETPMMTGTLVVGDGDGRTGAIFEKAPRAIEVLRPGDLGVVFATNHFVSPNMAGRDDPNPGEGSLKRYDRLRQLLTPGFYESRYGQLDPDGLARVMQDIVDAWSGEVPSRADLEQKGWDNNVGLGSNGPMHFVVFDPERRLFWLAAGKPPLHEMAYRCFSLEELLGRADAPACDPPTIGGHDPAPARQAPEGCEDRQAPLPFTALEDFSFLRGPLLQRVTSTEATVLWRVSPPRSEPGCVTLWPGDGEETLCAAPDGNGQYQVTLTGLAPATEIPYQVAVGDLRTGDLSFRTLPDRAVPVRFAVFADAHASAENLRRMSGIALAEDVDFAVVVGDLTVSGLREEYDAFFDGLRALGSRVGIWTVLGNHDSGHLEEYLESFSLPQGNWDEVANGLGEAFWSSRLGNVWIGGGWVRDFYFSAPDSDWGEVAWIRREASQRPFQTARWRLFFLHEPPYTAQWDQRCSYTGEWSVRTTLYPLLAEIGVQAAFHGHMHGIEWGDVNGVASFIIGGLNGHMDPDICPVPEDFPKPWNGIYGIPNFAIVDTSCDRLVVRMMDLDGSLIQQVEVPASAP
ncbi:metallophosphoesterase [Myxococcota bacterium]|nr:metallophosphoesterase [Myxococcota bacterium]